VHAPEEQEYPFGQLTILSEVEDPEHIDFFTAVSPEQASKITEGPT
jgi:hypothetical protein